MNKKMLLAVLSAVLLTSCSIFGGKDDGKGVNQTTPPVSVVNGQIVAPSALVFTKAQPVTVTWQLPAGSKARFPENGIVIEGRLLDEVIRGDKVSVVLDTRQTEIVECRRGKDGLEFSCLNKHTKPGIYKYTIRVIDENQKTIVLDPSVLNM